MRERYAQTVLTFRITYILWSFVLSRLASNFISLCQLCSNSQPRILPLWDYFNIYCRNYCSSSKMIFGGGGKLTRLWIPRLLWKSTLTAICTIEHHWFEMLHSTAYEVYWPQSVFLAHLCKYVLVKWELWKQFTCWHFPLCSVTGMNYIYWRGCDWNSNN